MQPRCEVVTGLGQDGSNQLVRLVCRQPGEIQSGESGGVQRRCTTMRYPTHLCGGLLALAIAIPSFDDDQQKAEKQLHKITAMATDGTGRRVVSITLADALGAKRLDLLMERRVMNLNYGDLLIEHALIKNGGKMEDIAAQLKTKTSLGEIAKER